MTKRLAYLLPRSVLYWVVIRVWADLTTRPAYSDCHPEQVTVFDALKELRTASLPADKIGEALG